MDKTVLRLLHEKISDEDMLLCLKVLERCFRVLESVRFVFMNLQNTCSALGFVLIFAFGDVWQ